MPLPALKQDDARIGVTILTFPHTCTVLWCAILGDALQAGLQRDEIKVVEHGSYFTSVISVSVFTVPWESRGRALEAVKQTLRELKILFLATIATETADKGWHTVNDIGLSGVPFDKAFLKESDIAAGRAAFEQSVAESTQVSQAFIAEMKSKLAGQNPNSGQDAK